MSFEKVYNTYSPTPLQGSSKNKTTDCPSCESDSFTVNIQTGSAQCFACGLKVNHFSYLTTLQTGWAENTTNDDLQELTDERGISVATLRRAGLAYDAYRSRWLLPYPNPFGSHLKNLGTFKAEGNKAYVVYKCPNDTGQFSLIPYCPVDRFGTASETPKNIVICEGEWDALAMIDLLNPTDSVAVIAVPGASMIPSMLDKFVANYDTVHLVYDNDQAGREGVAKMGGHLSGMGKKVLTFNWDDVSYPAGTDVRDLLTKYRTDVIGWGFFQNHCVESDIEESEVGELSSGYVTTIDHIAMVDSLGEYFHLYSQHFELTRTTENAMIAGLAVATSVYMGGEPLWVFEVGPASCGKTTFLESFGGKNDLFDYSSKLSSKNLVSGWSQGADNSFLNNLRDKMLVVKDFTTVLDMPKDQQRELFSILRDAYDGSLRMKFGNNVDRDYHNLNFNMLAGVTPAIYRHNDSDMGERFLRVNFVDDDSDEQRVISMILDSFGQTSNKKQALTEATLGFVKRIMLNKWDFNVPGRPVMLNQTDKIFIGSLARYVAKLRTKPEHDRTEGLKYRPQDETPGRLALQLQKIAYACCKVVDPEHSYDDKARVKLDQRTREVVRKVAIDTAKGFIQEVMQFIANNGGITQDQIAWKLNIPDQRVNKIMKDLELTKRVYTSKAVSTGGRPSKAYRLSPEMQGIIFDIEVG